ncbi:PmoA family protein, partial [Planctomycetota bacterium]
MKALAALLLVVSAGDHDRIDAPILFPCTVADLGLSPDDEAFALFEQGVKEPTPVFFQFTGDGRMVWTLPGKTPKGTTRTFKLTRLSPAQANNLKPTLRPHIPDDGSYVQMNHGGKPVLRYNHKVVKRFPDKPDKMDRGCYFHPLWTPSGKVVTGDFPADHLHHRGLWFSWVVANQGQTKANFWEFWQGHGQTINKKLTAGAGPAFARFVVQNECVSGGKTLLKETLTCRVYPRPTDVWLVDLDVKHEAVGGDVVLGKKHYGGLGFRGLDAWDGKDAPIDVVTSEGDKGRAGNAKPARWVDYTGKLPNGEWGGMLLIEHPDNPRYPNRLRIHPTMPFLSTTLCAPGPYTIKQGEPLLLRYRLVLHDGRPDKALADRLAADFVTPPKVELK